MMKKTLIPWVDYSINTVKGKCPVACSYCYARRLYDRFKWNPEIRYIEPGFTIAELQTIKKPSRIFWGSMFELFHPTIPDLWLKDTFEIVQQFPQHTFIFLTKCPQYLAAWSPFPPNCWVGVSVTSHEQLIKAQVHLAEIEAGVRFVSVEPFLSELETLVEGYWLGLFEVAEWGIFGSQTQPTKHPKLEAVKLAIECADWNRRPVFVKEPMASHYGINRKEFPIGVKQCSH